MLSTNNASVNSANGTFTVTADSTAPTGGSITANGSGSASYNSTGVVNLTVANFAETASATQSGLAAGTNTVTRASGTLIGNVCGSLTGATAVSIVSGHDSSTLGIGCYQYTLTAVDNVGNQVTVLSAVVMVDTSAPSAPALTISNVNPSAYYSGSGTQVFFRPQVGASGSFDLTASSTDADTGISAYNFPSLGSGWTTSGTGATRTYSYTAVAATPGAQTVSATNPAALTSGTTTFTVTADTTAPTTGALAPSGTVNASGTTSYSKTGTFTIARTDYVETASATASGLASSTLVRTQASYTNSTGLCGSFGTLTTVVGAVSETTLAEGCYLYTLTGTDHVGNAASVTVTVVVDKTAPTATNVTLNNGGTVGRADKGDTVVITYSETMNASSFCSSWANGSTQNLNGNGQVLVTITNAGTSDTLSVSTTSGCTFHLGTVALNADYVSATTSFSGSGANNVSVLTWDPVAKTLTITFGTGTGSATGVAASTPAYTADTGLVDLAGNAIGAGPFTGTSSRF